MLKHFKKDKISLPLTTYFPEKKKLPSNQRHRYYNADNGNLLNLNLNLNNRGIEIMLINFCFWISFLIKEKVGVKKNQDSNKCEFLHIFSFVSFKQKYILLQHVE